MHKKTLVTAIAVMAILMLAIIPVGAVTDGEPDGTAILTSG